MYQHPLFKTLLVDPTEREAKREPHRMHYGEGQLFEIIFSMGTWFPARKINIASHRLSPGG
jgi:hypothetical protein